MTLVHKPTSRPAQEQTSARVADTGVEDADARLARFWRVYLDIFNGQGIFGSLWKPNKTIDATANNDCLTQTMAALHLIT
jgi:hypothetical protein